MAADSVSHRRIGSLRCVTNVGTFLVKKKSVNYVGTFLVKKISDMKYNVILLCATVYRGKFAPCFIFAPCCQRWITSVEGRKSHGTKITLNTVFYWLEKIVDIIQGMSQYLRVLTSEI